MRLEVVSLWAKLNNLFFFFLLQSQETFIFFPNLWKRKLNRQKLQLSELISNTQILLMKQTGIICAVKSSELFLCRETREAERERERRRLVPLTVFLHSDWSKPVARLMSVLESFLLPFLCALIGSFWTGLVDFYHLLNIPTQVFFFFFCGSLVSFCTREYSSHNTVTHEQSLGFLSLLFFF